MFSSNASHDGVVDEDVVTLTCSVSLRDYLIYSISILDTFGNSLNHSNGTLDTSYDTVNYISAEYSVHANSTIDETFKCIIEFFDAYVDSHDKGTLFYNRTLYTSLDVMCKFNSLPRYCLDTYLSSCYKTHEYLLNFNYLGNIIVEYG